MKIYIHFLSPVRRFAKPSEKFLKKVVTTTLKSESAYPAGEVNVIFVNGKKIRELNKEFLDEKGDTDVIAFPYGKPLFGDIYISVDQAKRNAVAYQQRPEQELTRLLIHGTLHILGYDDHSPKEQKNMWSRQETLVNKFFPGTIKNPS